ncbi:RNA polymerase I-specific transcription initiation factor RRN3 [Syncephalis fuscata]|nr:RNA polymerase I-specific transcription initiation factor RRN3 [Syncephalis fuscata]
MVSTIQANLATMQDDTGSTAEAGKPAVKTDETQAMRENAIFLTMTFAATALKDHKQGDLRRYNDMVHKLSDRNELTPEKQLHWLAALTNYVSALTPECSTLNLMLVKAYATFFEHLVSAQAFYVVPVMRSLVSCFRSYANDGVDASHKQRIKPDTVRLVHDRVHRALHRIISLIPTATPKLATVLSENFPYKLDTTIAQTTYLKNVLCVLEYAPMLRDSLLQTTIERLLRIDVDIQVELDELDDNEDEDDLADDMFAMENNDTFGKTMDGEEAHTDEEDEEDGETDEEDGYETEEEPEVLVEEPAEMSVAEIRGLSDKLDQMMVLVFEYLNVRRVRYPNASTEDFYLLLDIFDRSILCTFKSRHTQFLLFNAASVNNELADIFLGHLMSKLCNTANSSVIRVAAASYLASFVARASFLSRDTIRNVMKILVGWAQIYVNDHETETTFPDLERYTVFYTAVQAIIYIFCFRWRDLRMDTVLEEANAALLIDNTTTAATAVTSDSNQQEWFSGLAGLQPILTSKFNPLKVCSPSVVQQFARLTRRLNFLYVYPIIERNKHIYLSSRHNNKSMKSKISFELEAFFPFDPYRLAQSSRYVDQLYQEWQPDSDAEEEEEEEEEDEEDEEDYDEEDDILLKQTGSTLAQALLDNSFDDTTLAMSISPQGGLLDAQRRALLFSND